MSVYPSILPDKKDIGKCNITCNFVPFLDNALKTCKIVQNDYFIKIIPLQTEFNNYIKQSNIKYSLESMNIFYGQVHGFNENISCEFQLRFKFGENDIILLCVPVKVGSNTKTSDFFKSVIHSINNSEISTKVTPNDLLPKENGYYYYKPKFATSDIKEGKTKPQLSIPPKAVYVYSNPIYIANSEYEFLNKQKKHDIVSHKSDLSSIFFNESSKVKHPSIIGNDIYIDCQDTENEQPPIENNNTLSNTYSMILLLIVIFIIPPIHYTSRQLELGTYASYFIYITPFILMCIVSTSVYTDTNSFTFQFNLALLIILLLISFSITIMYFL